MRTPTAPRLFAVIPAAGRARRMGRPKLLLPLGGRTVIAHLLDALDHPRIAERLVVVRPGDEPLREETIACGGTPVVPETPPPDMRQSVAHALDHIRARWRPAPEDGWLLIPADHPVLQRDLVDQLVAHWQQGAEGARILIPTHAGRRGHPTFFRWSLADEVAALPPDQGLNRLVAAHEGEVTEVDVGTQAILCDLDTPEDYAALRRQWE